MWYSPNVLCQSAWTCTLPIVERNKIDTRLTEYIYNKLTLYKSSPSSTTDWNKWSSMIATFEWHPNVSKVTGRDKVTVFNGYRLTAQISAIEFPDPLKCGCIWNKYPSLNFGEFLKDGGRWLGIQANCTFKYYQMW